MTASRPTLVVIAVLGAGPVSAQTAAEFVDLGVAAYRDLAFDSAAVLLNRALTRASRLDAGSRQMARVHLGGAHVFQGHLDSAAAVFQDLIVDDPRYRIDRLSFPPEVTVVFDDVLAVTPTVAASMPDQVRVVLGRDSVNIDLVPSTPHTILVEHYFADGAERRTIYAGPIRDSLRVRWDPGRIGVESLERGTQWLSVGSNDTRGRAVRRTQVAFTVRLEREDSLPEPTAPIDRLLPERAESQRSRIVLATGVVGGVLAIAAPSVISPDGDLGGSRFAIGLGLSLAGALGYWRPSPGPVLDDNVEANRVLMEGWRQEVVRVQQENERRGREVTATIRSEEPVTSNVRPGQ